MKKLTLLIMMIFVSSINYAQNCDCSSNLKWLIETFEKNDAGFQYVIDKKGKNTYLVHNKAFKEKASKINNKTECLKLLNDWTEFFRKNHLGVNLTQKTITSKNQKELSENEILKLYKDSPKFEIKENKFYKYLQQKNKIHPFEGVWSFYESNKFYTIGIIKTHKNKNPRFVGFILKSNSPNWQKNQIKFEIYKNKTDKYYMKYYTLNHKLKIIKNIESIGEEWLLANLDEINGDNYIKNIFLILRKDRPTPKRDKYINIFFLKSIYKNRPLLYKINDNTLLLRIPSFSRSIKKEIDSLLVKNNDLISKTKNLIVDLRNNTGGSTASYKNIIPYLYTNPIRGLGVQYLSTKLNNKRMIEYMNNPDWSEEEKEWAKNGLEKLNKHLGEFVNLEDDIVDIDTLDTILPYPKNVAILINKNCYSATEQFLLVAKQSKKVKLFGTTTGGALDISNMYSVNSPCGDYQLWYALTKSYRIPEMLIDEKGIQPDFYFDKTIKPYEWIKKTEEILNYKP